MTCIQYNTFISLCLFITTYINIITFLLLQSLNIHRKYTRLDIDETLNELMYENKQIKYFDLFVNVLGLEFPGGLRPPEPPTPKNLKLTYKT